MPLAYAPSYPTFMSIPNAQMMGGQVMSSMGGFGDYMGQQMDYMSQQLGQQMGQQILPTMAGVRPYTATMNTGMLDQGRYSVMQQMPMQLQQQASQVQPPPRVMDANRGLSPSHTSTRALKIDNEQLVKENAELKGQISRLHADVELLKQQLNDLVRLNEQGSSSPMPTPAVAAPRPTLLAPKRAVTPVSGTEENLRGLSGSGSQLLHASSSASYHGRFPSASRSNNSLATSRSGTFSSGVRPAWKTMNAHSSPLSIGAQFRQISGPNGCITLGITKLATNGPAEIAGLRLGDILEECEFKAPDEKNGFFMRRLSGCGFSKNALQKSLSTLKVGDEARFAVNRDGERFEVSIALIPIDQCEWSGEGEALDRSFTPTDDMLNEVPTMPEFNESDLSMDEKPRSQRWEAGWRLNYDAFLRFCINEAKMHVGDDFVTDDSTMQRFEDACRACELQLIKEGHGDVRVASLWNNRDLILHFTGQQCEDQNLLMSQSASF